MNDQFIPAVDFSYWNTHLTSPNIEKLNEAGIFVCMVRFGKGKNELGPDLGVDRALDRNIQAIADGGMMYMPYWRIFNLEDSHPVAQASLYVELLYKYNYNAFRAPVWVDCEEWQYDTDNQRLGPDVVAHWITSFMDTLATNGFRHIGIYTRASWWSPNVTPIGVMNGYPLWVAHWPLPQNRHYFASYRHNVKTWDEYVDEVLPSGPSIPSPWVNWDIWQFIGEGSGIGKQLGFDSEHLDCNLIRMESFERWFG